MTREHAMIRYVLIGLSLLLAATDYFTRGIRDADHTATSGILQSLTFAFTPAFVGFALAYACRIWRAARGKPDAFATDVNWIWGIFVVILLARTVIPLAA